MEEEKEEEEEEGKNFLQFFLFTKQLPKEHYKEIGGGDRGKRDE